MDLRFTVYLQNMLRAMQCLCIDGLNQTLHLVAIIPLVSMKLWSTRFRATSIRACSCVCVRVHVYCKIFRSHAKG